MSYRMNSKLQEGAEPYSHADHVDASVTLDVGPILREALDRLGYPLPLGASPTSLDKRVRQLLAEAGVVRFTADDYRRFLKKAIAELSDARDSNIARKVAMDPNTPSGRDLLAARADQILHARGVFDPTPSEYSDALDEAAVELADDDPDAVVYPGDPAREAVHLAALKILADNRNFDYDSDDYLKAVGEAERVLSINTNTRGR